MSDNGKKDRSTIIQTGIVILLIVNIGYIGYSVNLLIEKQDHFMDRWEARIKVSNAINNGTRETIRNEVHQLLGNLTAHRHVTNQTFEEVKNIQNDTAKLVEAFNQSNEEGREKAVDKLHADHEVIMNALNISKTDNQTEAASKVDLLLEFLNKTQ